MSKDEDKAGWGSVPSTRPIPKDKIDAFEYGTMNFQKKHLSKKEQDELRKKQEEEAEAEVLRDYLASFQEIGKAGKTFVKGSTINPATKEEKLTERGMLYKPALKLQDKLLSTTPPVSRTTIAQMSSLSKSEKKETESEKTKRLQQEKKKSNLETFKEELKRMQEERDARHRNRHQIHGNDPTKAKNDTERKTDTSFLTDTGKQLIEEDLTTNIFLSNLNSTTNERDLMEKFGRYGPLASVKIMWPRTEEERQRGANCGFVAFMSRRDAENALNELDGTSIDGVSLRLSWSKFVALPPQPIYIPPHLIEVTVPPPPSGLPFNAQPKKQTNESDLYKILENSTVKVTIPTDRQLLCLIHRMIEFVVREGPAFEAVIMAKEINNPQFRFLFDNQSPAHIYYRWKLFSILQGDSVSDWSTESFQMFKSGSFWMPPICNSYTKGEKDEAYEAVRQELDGKKGGQLSDEHRDKLEDILRNLTTLRASIGDAMVFCIDQAEFSEEIVECIVESLTILHTPISKKVARLFLLSDLLHNCSVKRANASFYRKGFERFLPDIFKHLNSVLDSIDGKMKSESFKTKVMNCIRAWEDMTIYPFEFLFELRASFLGMSKKKLQFDNSNSGSTDNNGGQQQQQDMDIDGKPLDSSANDYPKDNDEDIDGKPLNEYDEDIDGNPLSDDEDLPKDKSGNQEMTNKFIQSKWQEVNPEVLEKQAITTSKWDFFDEYQSDKSDNNNNNNDSSQDSMMDDQQQRKHDSGNSKSSSNENCSNDNSYNQHEQQSYMDTVALYQQYTEQKKELSEEKRQMLRDIEVKAVKYMDDLESGRVESKSNLTIQQQVDTYRHKLFRDKFEKVDDKKSDKKSVSPQTASNSNAKNNSRSADDRQPSSTYYHRATNRDRTKSKSKSRSRTRSRSRSRSPSHRYRQSSSRKKYDQYQSRHRSRSSSPSKHYHKKIKH